MAAMRPTSRRLPLALAGLVISMLLTGCGTTPPQATPTPAAETSLATPGATPTAALTTAPSPTPVPMPSASAVEPDPVPGGGSFTITEWGAILDAVPADFPVFPDARPAEALDEPASGFWLAEAAAVDNVATWYRDALEAAGYTTQDLSSPLEDGSRVLDTVSDLPECRIQTTFRPVDGSTIIKVLYGAGCAGAGG